MKAAFLTETGACDVIQYGDQPEPQLAPGQVLIQVAAVSVNPIDTYVRSGLVAFEVPQPYYPGCDAAGVVAQVADDVTEFKVGQRVWCTNQGLLGRQGTFAEQIAVDAEWCYPTPDGVDDVTAAANALVGVTAHLGLFQRGRLRSGQTVFVVGGSGGVGSMVVQMAKNVGARVITTAGSPERAEIARQLGADQVIQYRDQAIADGLAEFAPDGVDLFWETRRMPDFDLAVSALAPRGQMIVMAGRDSRPEFPVGPFYVKECTLHGFVMFKGSATEIGVCAAEMNQWMAAGKLAANIAKTFPLREAADAHRLQETDNVGGKIVLTL